MTGLVPRTAALLLLALCVAACDAERPVSLGDAEAQSTWDALQEEHNAATYGLFIKANRMAARHHVSDALGGSAHDAKGIKFQLRAVEAQSHEALRTSDAGLATVVHERVSELVDTELLPTYEEHLPGSSDRFVAARDRVLPLLAPK